jgi:uncharacterized protein YybS (DUF2232 family)
MTSIWMEVVAASIYAIYLYVFMVDFLTTVYKVHYSFPFITQFDHSTISRLFEDNASEEATIMYCLSKVLQVEAALCVCVCVCFDQHCIAAYRLERVFVSQTVLILLSLLFFLGRPVWGARNYERSSVFLLRS